MEVAIMVQRVLSLSNLFVVILFCSCGASLQKPPPQRFNAALLQLYRENGVIIRQGKPFTGIVYTLQANQKDTLEIVGFREGKEHGEWKKFYPDGHPLSTRFYTNGEKAGNFVTWWPNGNKQLDYHFEDGEYEGRCLEWNEQGVLINERNYKRGYEEGPQKQFYDNGKVKSNYVMIDGKRYGLLGTKNCVNVTDSVFKK